MIGKIDEIVFKVYLDQEIILFCVLCFLFVRYDCSYDHRTENIC